MLPLVATSHIPDECTSPNKLKCFSTLFYSVKAMREWKRLLSWNRWNKVFWTLFIVMGIILIAGAAAGVLSMVEVLVAFVVIAIGAEKLGEEISDKRLQEEQDRINRDLIFISRWLESNNVFTRQVKDRHELRLLKLDNKRAEIEEKQELNYRELAKKIFDVENRMNEISKALLQEIKSMDRDRKQEIRNLQDKMERLSSRVMRPPKKK